MSNKIQQKQMRRRKRRRFHSEQRKAKARVRVSPGARPPNARRMRRSLAELESSLGRFYQHQFCIELSSNVYIFRKDGELRGKVSRDSLAVFTHEYYHYVQNLSTISGWITFEQYQKAIAIFSSTLDTDAQCHPERLTPESEATLNGISQYIVAIEGGRGFKQGISKVAAVRFVSLHIGEAPNFIVNVTWDVRRRDSSTKLETIAAGGFLIQEGVSYILEGFVSLDKMLFNEDDSSAPPYPYHAYRILCRSIAPEITPLAAVKLGVLSLNSPTPGASLIDALKKYKEVTATGISANDACAMLAELTAPRVKAVTDLICEERTKEIALSVTGRGHIESGIASAISIFQDLLSRRSADPWFDLAWCSSGDLPLIDELLALHKSLLPCDILQIVPEPEAFGRDYLLTYMDTEGSFHDGLRALHSQLRFFLVHYNPPGAFLADGWTWLKKCPYYTACHLEMRKNEPDICAQTPWKRGTLPNTCWYGTAVKGTIGLVQITSKTKVDPDSA